MKKNKEGFSRRDFLKGAAGFTVIGAAGVPLCRAGQEKIEKGSPLKKMDKEQAAEPKMNADVRSKVVMIRDEKVIDDSGKVNAEVLEAMLDQGMSELFGVSDSKGAWKKLFTAEDVVGIKSNAWRFLATPPELEKALTDRLINAGVSKDKISVDDRGVLNNEIFKNATALINVRPMRTHHWSGVGSLIKNYIMFHPQPWTWHDDSCAGLAGLWDLPNVKGKTRLNILVMLTPLFHGKGPHHFQAKYTWPYK
ncbi:MAG: twin-arginine translocation signal domain-containing protein, partial [Planctomycetes bacterium]|nr:twin-arginine translocation signal domain-containing protein [Planctomycetota bacterium]